MIGKRPVWAVRTVGGLSAGAVPLSPRSNDDAALNRIWEREGLLRLFLSHVSAHKTQVSALKRALRPYGVAAFVAHEDIEPTIEWQSEMQVALTTAHTVAALLTEDFHESHWTDQEVGIGIGRGLFVFGIQLPTPPYGFLGRLQGLPGDLAKPNALAKSIIDILLKRSETSSLMREALVVAVESSGNYSDSNLVIGRIEQVSGFTQPQLERLRAATISNHEVVHAFALPKLEAYLGRELGPLS